MAAVIIHTLQTVPNVIGASTKFQQETGQRAPCDQFIFLLVNILGRCAKIEASLGVKKISKTSPGTPMTAQTTFLIIIPLARRAVSD